MKVTRSYSVLTLSLVLTLALLALPASAADKPVKVYILSGQSNMVGIGQVTGGGSRWGSEFIDPVLSVYPGKYDPKADYEKMPPTKTLKLDSFGGVKPTPYLGGGTQIVRGFIQIKTTGVYELRPGYGGSTHNIMEVDGKEVYRKAPGNNAVHTHIKLTEGKKVPFKITYLTDQANGLGWIARVDIPGTLATVVKQNGKFPYLVDKQGNWVERKDVWYKGVVTAGANKWLSVGCGAGSNNIGPELGFGHIVGDFHDEPVLILKASQGNRSLGWDYLPPGSKQFEDGGYVYAGYKDSPARWEKGTKPKPINWYAGKQYDDCFSAAHKVLNNFDKEFPHWKGRGYEIAGFVWWQGHKDGGEPNASRYEQNLVHLIKTLRKDFDAPKAPFAIATIGFGGWKMSGPHKTVAEAQLAVSGDKGKYPEFKGSVQTVETRGFWREAEVSPRNQGFHYNQNAETYMLVGETLGKGMLKLLKPVSDEALRRPAFKVIEVQQTGGFAGVNISYRITPDGKFVCKSRRGTAAGKLDAKDTKALLKAVAVIDWKKMPAKLRDPKVADDFIYDMHFVIGKKTHRVTADGTSAGKNKQLKPILMTLVKIQRVPVKKD